MGGLFGKMKLRRPRSSSAPSPWRAFPALRFSQDLILEQLLHAELFFPYARVVAAFLTAFYMGRVVFLAASAPL